ncbi:methyl-accepting chemotaxis protein [Ideonella sp.]|uniref:methyl-accepting chemotaxis protein n=1 Tax=Ideonella sp. TaxID=1929293 RepID=UPI002B47D007|nr:methyl-accepting chemotaxis protein [Ideonella sp.]HJV69473.1 methyl-accepting chemotaxis protein [Ideonella sp.]
MVFLSNMKIGARLALAFGAFIVLLLAICGYSALTSSRLAADLEATATIDLTRVQLAYQLEQQAGLIARASRELLLVDGAGQIKKQRELIKKNLADADLTFGKLAELGSAGDAEQALAAVRESREQYTKAVGKFLETLDAGNPDDARTSLLIELRPVQAGYEKAVDALAAVIASQAEDRAGAGQKTAQATTFVTLALGAVGVVLAIGAGITIARSITRPLGRAVAAAEAIKAGDLRGRIEAQGRDEIATLLAAMRDMQGHLTHVIEDVTRAARDVASSSDEIAHGNADLSARTERASTNLQQTASAMEQISATVAGSSAKSRAATDVANRARAAVIEGGESVDSLVGTMTRIAESSNRIKDIIAVIDGIAFQTNILALNAAVEAARAGEQGRGFAVVAGEVRSLAARASSAAKEIKVLIDDSADKVAVGTQTVADVGSRIKGIVDEVVGVRQLIEEVSVASSQQESGIGAVNDSVAVLDQATQQNAALVEELAATTESLKSNASRLVSSVEFFRIPAVA